MMTKPMCRVSSTMNVLSTLGRMCTAMMRSVRAAAHPGQRDEVARLHGEHLAADDAGRNRAQMSTVMAIDHRAAGPGPGSPRAAAR